MTASLGWVAVFFSAALFVRLLAARRPLQGTTLIAPWAWCLAATLGMGGVEFWAIVSEPSPSAFSLASARYLAAVGWLCPMVAVLGAKRPQNRAWQWVVLALWCVMCLPVFQAMAVGMESTWELPGAWKGFAAALIAMTFLSYGPTRHFLSALFAVAGQLGSIGPFAWPEVWAGTANGPAWGLGLLCTSAWLVRRSPWRATSSTAGAPTRDALEGRWRSFLDGWGAFWAVRLAARLNQTAELQDWPVRFGLRGLVARRRTSVAAESRADRSLALQPRDAETLAPETRTQISAGLDGALWRFERLAQRVADSATTSKSHLGEAVDKTRLSGVGNAQVEQTKDVVAR